MDLASAGLEMLFWLGWTGLDWFGLGWLTWVVVSLVRERSGSRSGREMRDER